MSGNLMLISYAYAVIFRDKCKVLHDFYGDVERECGERDCFECESKFLIEALKEAAQ